MRGSDSSKKASINSPKKRRWKVWGAWGVDSQNDSPGLLVASQMFRIWLIYLGGPKREVIGPHNEYICQNMRQGEEDIRDSPGTNTTAYPLLNPLVNHSTVPQSDSEEFRKPRIGIKRSVTSSVKGGGGEVHTMAPPSILNHQGHQVWSTEYHWRWKMGSMHQWGWRISQGRWRGRQVKGVKKAHSQMIKVGDSITNSVSIDILEKYYDTIMAVDSLDNEGRGGSDTLVQTCLPKLLYNIQPMKSHPGSSYM